ncbi:MAG: ATP-binding protein [Dehalococcoidia bacterium]|nr:ATP-binding protein [Dehalococcoidia bacterium]
MGGSLVNRGANPAPGRVFRKGVLPAEGPFVGRDMELRRLGEALSLAAEGQGGIIFLAGQRGIGKTRWRARL